MGRKDILITLFFFSSCVGIWAKEVTDTLVSAKRDRVIVTYDVEQAKGQVVVRFRGIQKKLGTAYKDKYKKLDEVVVLFFDRKGGFKDKMEFRGMDAEPFMIPKEVNYQRSEDGYFFVNDNDCPPLSFELKSTETAELSIPMYLAHYEGKRRYQIFSRCEDLVVKLSKGIPVKGADETSTQQTTETVTLQEEIDGNGSDEEVATLLMQRITECLNEQDEYPFSDNLKQDISELQKLQLSLTSNRDLSSKISEVLADCRKKEKELKADASAAAEKAAKEAEMQAEREAQKEQARQDSIAAAAHQKAEEEKKQNLWMIIGGVILAILAFVGNQVLQHFRNVKNQENLMSIQEKVAKQAESEAKRRARNMAESQMNRAKGEVRKKSRDVVNKGIGKKGKDSKGFSI